MSVYQTALTMCQIALAEKKKQTGLPLTRDQIVEGVDQIRSIPMFAESIDRDFLIADLEQIFTVWSNPPTAMGSDDDHVPWLSQRRGEIDWKFWARYKLYMAGNQKMVPAAIENVEKVIDEVLGRIEDPERDGSWDRRGLVMGNVQSGKTGTYTGLICKAADVGYKVVIVLAGMHNNLRSQTQIRLDEGFLGYKAAPPSEDGAALFEPTGVAEYGTNARADSVTNRSELGDFSRRVARHFAIHPGGNPLLFVVKKNVSVLLNLLGWIHSSADSTDPETGRKFHRHIPLLVIDDEADQASVDTKKGVTDENGAIDEDHDPTKTNKLIRSLLFSFEKSAYVGFTATPFANIYIHEQAKTKELGDDLFPRSFIVNLPAPSNYAGASRIFGIEADEDVGLEEAKSLPIVRVVDDHADSDAPDETGGWIPPKLELRTDHIPLYGGQRSIPPSLRKALMSFLLSTATRRIRETGPLFNSMLIHVVRFTKVQAIVKEEVEKEIAALLKRLQYGDGDKTPSIIEEFKELWDQDYIPTTSSFGDGFALPTWDEIAKILPKIVSSIVISEINGSARDALAYEENRETGLNIVAIGGDKLSRGLTLEGLTVSYFLRSSRMYDTLMQMGRWFGYKERYLDVCRLFTTEDLYSWFQHIAAATEELRLLFEEMVAVGATPRQFGLKVRAHPVMLVTSAVKMRSGTKLSLSYAGDISETIVFDIPKSTKKNLDATNLLLRGLAPQVPVGKKAGGYLWKNVDVRNILEFLRFYETHPDSRRADTRLLSSYILRQNTGGELIDWSVLLVSSDRKKGADGREGASDLSGHFDGLQVGSIERAYHGEQITDRYTIRRLVSPSDEIRDLTHDERAAALAYSNDAWIASTRKDKSTDPPVTPSGQGIRRARPKERALLMIYPLDGVVAKTEEGKPVVGIAISFPASDTAREIDYVVTNLFTKLGDYDDL